MASGGINRTMTVQYCIRGVYLLHSPKQRCQSISNSGRQVKSRMVDSVKNHRSAFILKKSLSPSPLACEIVSHYILLKQVESTQYNVWERIISLSTRTLQSWSSTNKGLLGTSVLDRLIFCFIKIHI